jgi:hypothetical protein
LSWPLNRPSGVVVAWRGWATLRALAVRQPLAVPRENAVAMLGDRPLLAVSLRNRRLVYIRGASWLPGSPSAGPPSDGTEIINVLRHDLPRPERPANISTVEREASHLRRPGRACSAAQANTDRRAASDVIAAFIDYNQASGRARRGECCALQLSAARAVERSGAWRIAGSCVSSRVLDGPMLRLSARCTSVLASVYSGPGATRGEGSGGVGTRHAGDGSRH